MAEIRRLLVIVVDKTEGELPRLRRVPAGRRALPAAPTDAEVASVRALAMETLAHAESPALRAEKAP